MDVAGTIHIGYYEALMFHNKPMDDDSKHLSYKAYNCLYEATNLIGGHPGEDIPNSAYGKSVKTLLHDAWSIINLLLQTHPEDENLKTSQESIKSAYISLFATEPSLH